MPAQECSYIYPDGRGCRRIPKKGQKLCHGHQHPRRLPGQEDDAFIQQMSAWASHLHHLPLDQLLERLNACLSDVLPVLERKASRRHRITFTRATIAVTTTVDALQAAILAGSVQSSPRPLPRREPIPASLKRTLATQLQSLESMDPADPGIVDAIRALSTTILSTAPSYAEPHPLRAPVDTPDVFAPQRQR